MNRIQHSKSTTTISVEVVIFKEDDNYVAFCPALNLSAYDSTIQGAKDAFEINMKYLWMRLGGKVLSRGIC